MDLNPDPTARAVVPVLACVLNQLVTKNNRIPLDQRHVTKFHALRPPNISIRDYLERVMKYAGCSGECFVLALIYIDRIIQTNPTFVVNSLNIHRLLITSVMLGAKFFDDQYFNNAYYAKVGGVPCNEVNHLEVEFLFMTNFNLYVGTDTYARYYSELVKHVQHSSCQCGNQGIIMPALAPRLGHLGIKPAPRGPAVPQRPAPAPGGFPPPGYGHPGVGVHPIVHGGPPSMMAGGMGRVPGRPVHDDDGPSDMATDSPALMAQSASPPVHAR